MEFYCDQDGQYNWANDLLTFEESQLTETQWERFRELDGHDRYIYLAAILNGDADELAELEESFGYNTEED